MTSGLGLVAASGSGRLLRAEESVDRPVNCLVDFSNVQPSLKTQLDVQLALEECVHALIKAVKLFSPTPTELRLRLYGGWLLPDDTDSHVAQWLLAEMAAIRGRREGVRILPSYATAMAEFPNVRLVGTLRKIGGKYAQKMVDSMLGLDLIYLVSTSDPAILLSDDDDLMPAVLKAASLEPSGLVLIRRRAAGSGMNDHCLTHSNYKVSVVTY